MSNAPVKALYLKSALMGVRMQDLMALGLRSYKKNITCFQYSPLYSYIKFCQVVITVIAVSGSKVSILEGT